MAKDLKEQIEIMTHYLNGGEIECSIKRQHNWKTFSSYYWNWQKMDYRIKEQKQKEQKPKVTIEKWLMQSTIDKEYRIIETSLVDKVVNFKKVKLLETYEVEL